MLILNAHKQVLHCVCVWVGGGWRELGFVVRVFSQTCPVKPLMKTILNFHVTTTMTLT